jgi:diguanylate cyclase (GGDEF)-like protein
MHFWSIKTLKSLFLPGGVILLGAAALLKTGWIPLPLTGVKFFYDAVFIACLLLAWRFHSTRILFCAIMLLLAHQALEFFGQGRIVASGPGRIAFEAVALLIPFNFVLLTFLPERSSEGRTVFECLLLLFFESIFVAVLARPEQSVPAFLHSPLIHSIHLRIPQPAIAVFILAWGRLLYRILQFHKAIDNGMLWALAAVFLSLNAGGAGRLGTVYFGVAAFILASSVVENSYSLAYRDELTGLDSRRAFNDALVRLKHPYALAAVDIDHFKSINDSYGHDTGDQVLRMVAARLARVSGGGQSFRVGGEEFTILFPAKTAKDVSQHLEILRMDIESCSFRMRASEERRKVPRDTDRRASVRKPQRSMRPHSGALSVTVSIGIAESRPKLPVDEAIQLADKALYRAKHTGRNRIIMAIPQGKLRRQAKRDTAKP